MTDDISVISILIHCRQGVAKFSVVCLAIKAGVLENEKLADEFIDYMMQNNEIAIWLINRSVLYQIINLVQFFVFIQTQL